MTKLTSAFKMTTPEQAPLYMCAGKENAGKVPMVDDFGFITKFVKVDGTGEFHNPKFTGLATCENFKLQGDFVCENGATVDFTGAEVIGVPTGEIIKTTYAELVKMKTAGTLNTGTWYRIIDFVSETSQTSTESANHPFDIIVLAISKNTFSEDAKAIQHEGDTYFNGQNLQSWKIKYCFDNNATRFDWAHSLGKGVIYYLCDEKGNSAYYDFKGIKVKNSIIQDRFYYLFDSNGTDNSLSNNVYNNTFGKSYDPTRIGKNIFLGEKVYNNKIGDQFSENVIRDNFYSNSIGNYFYNNNLNSFFTNIIGNNFYNNTIGQDCYINTIGNNFYNNTIGTNFYSNTIGNAFYENTIGNNCFRNHIGNIFLQNTILNYFYSNNIGNYFYNNKTGTGFNYNHIGADFANNDLTSFSTRPRFCIFPCGVEGMISASSPLTRFSKTTYYIGSDNSLKTLD